MKRTPYNPSRFDGGKTMIKAVLQTATFLGAISCFGLVNATETRTPLVPLPSVVDFTDGDGWGVGLGLGVEYETAYEGSDEFELEVDPAGGVQWRTGDHLFSGQVRPLGGEHWPGMRG